MEPFLFNSTDFSYQFYVQVMPGFADKATGSPGANKGKGGAYSTYYFVTGLLGTERSE
jgi:hypothetical protein